MKKPVKIIAALAAAIMSLSGLTAVQAAEQETAGNTLVLVDCTDTARYDGTIFKNAVLNENKQYTYGDRAASARFKINAGKSQTVYFNLDEAVDLSAYRTFTVRAYSDAATGNPVNLTMYDEDGTKYWRCVFNQNWTGWKDLKFAINPTMSFTNWGANNGAADVASIKQIDLNEGGWSTSASILACNLYIDSIFVTDETTIGDGEGLRKLFNVSKDTTYIGDYNSSSVKLSVAAGKSGTLKSGRGNGTDRLASTEISQDISEYKTINCNVYNETADSSSTLHLCIYTQPDAAGNYYVYDVPLDWTGWKTVTADLDKPSHSKLTAVTDTADVQYNPRTHMEGFAVNSGAWHVNAADVTCYVDSVWFSKDNGSNVIFDGSDSDSIAIFGLGASTVNDVPVGDFQGTGEAIQRYNSGRKTLLDFGIAKDWTEYDKLTMLVYANDYDDGDVLEIVPYVSGSAYYIYKLPIDWSGWKEISIPLSDFEQKGNISWSNIERFVLSYGKYGGSQTSVNTDLCFDKIVLQKDGDGSLTGNLVIEKDNMGIYTAKATILTSERNIPYELILSAKSKDNVFKTAATDSDSSNGFLRVDLSAEYTPDDDADIKAMLWNSVSDMKPYLESVVR